MGGKGKKKKADDETKGDSEAVDKASLRAKFDEIDKDGSGEVDKEELKCLLKDCSGVDPSDIEVDEMMELVDTDGSGTMDFDEFVNVYKKVQKGEVKFEAFETMMKDFDTLVNTLEGEDAPEEPPKDD